MHREIERKFLTTSDSWRSSVQSSQHIRQGYLNRTEPPNKSSARVRIIENTARLTIKSLEIGISRDEMEYTIPIKDAEYMLTNFCIDAIIEKKRHKLVYEQHIWEIDEFLDHNSRLVIAEVELKSPKEIFMKPDWLGTEVTYNTKYYNTSLSKNP